MQAVQPTPILLEALSSRLLLGSELPLWRHVFLRGAHSSVRWLQGKLFLLYSDAPERGWQSSDLNVFADRFGGWHETLASAIAQLAFTDAASAVAAALLLQKIGADSGVRAVLTNGNCTVATVDGPEGRRRVLVQGDGADARQALRRAAPSTVLICAEAYSDLEGLLADESDGVLVTTEYNGNSIAEACVTLLPETTSAMSTFAGLGAC